MYFQDGEFTRTAGTELQLHRGYLLPVPKTYLRVVLTNRARVRRTAKIALGQKRKSKPKPRTKRTPTKPKTLELTPEARKFLGI